MIIVILIVVFVVFWLVVAKRDTLRAWREKQKRYGKTQCPACHRWVRPCPMIDGDVMHIYSQDGYYLHDWNCQSKYYQDVCPNCQYAIKEYKNYE